MEEHDGASGERELPELPNYGDITTADGAPPLSSREVTSIVAMGVSALPKVTSLAVRGGSDVVQALAVRRQAGEGGESAERRGTRWTQFGRVVLIERGRQSPEAVVYWGVQAAVAAVRSERTSGRR